MDRKAQELFFRFLKLEESAGEAILTEESNLFEEILASYSSKIIPEAGNNKVEQRDNIARALDEHVRRRVASLSRLRTERYTVADVRREIPEDAVLIDIYRPRFQEELNPVFCLLLTREEGRLFIIEGAGRGIGWTEFEGETSVHRVGVDGVVIAGLRSALQEGTEGGKPLTDEAQHLLQVCFRTYFGYAVEYLDTLYSRGKRHLIIIPSGPLHFLPFHLLGMSGLPLAERWIVSYLPTIDLLRRPAYSGETRSGAGIYAISYREPWAKQRGHTPLENSLNEANTIAHTLGVRAKTDEDVTRATVREGLRTSRFVHLACHGGHNVAAPSLQCLYLTPEYEDDDGRLFCVDILGFDLRGLSLLGLSACETALGRFDAGDNLRGLSAAALTAGASSVIGTLWPTADDTSEVFFTTLYANLMAGETRLGAYRKAQVKTRRLFPEYWDWGAFYLSGLW